MDLAETRPKKPKVTKAEKLALKLAEENKARLEEERLRKEEEQEAKRKAEEERLRQLELEKSKLEEEEKRKEDYNRLNEIFTTISEAYNKELKLQWENSQWHQYVNVWKVINPFSLPMVNTFLSDWDEDESCGLKKFFASYHQCMEIIQELESAFFNSPELTENNVRLWNEILTNIKSTISRKLDFLTFHLLQNGADYLSPDSYNMECCITDTHFDDVETQQLLTLGLCIWINFVKNVRYKGMHFPDLGLTFELPDPLVMQPCAVRILYILFDDLTCEEVEMKSPSQSELHVEKAELQKEDSKVTISGTEQTEDKETEIPPGTVSSAVKSVSSHTETSETDSFITSSSEHLPVSDSSESPGKVSSISSGISATTVQVTASIAESGKTASMTFPLPQEPELQFVDKSLYFRSGGIFHMDLLEVPLQPLHVGSWIFILTQDKDLKRIPYKACIVPIRQAHPDMSALVAAEFAHFEISRYEKEIIQAISISLRLPENVVFVEKPLLAFWMEKEKVFTTNGIFDTQLDGDGMLSFKTSQLGKIALFQRKYSNLPYISWQLIIGKEKNSATFTIKGTMLEIELQISATGCCVSAIHFNENKVLEDLYLQFMTPVELIEKLLSVGINIKFDESGLQENGFKPKNDVVETWVYACMSILTDTFNFSSSPWNSVSPEKCVFRCKEKSHESESFLVIVDAERALRLMSTDDSQPFSDERCPNQKFHSDLYQLLMCDMKKPLYEGHEDIDVHFLVNLRLLLNWCKILSCS